MTSSGRTVAFQLAIIAASIAPTDSKGRAQNRMMLA
jgi:hypothetical protein